MNDIIPKHHSQQESSQSSFRKDSGALCKPADPHSPNKSEVGISRKDTFLNTDLDKQVQTGSDNYQQEVKKEQGDFQPTLETRKKTEQLHDRKKGAVIPDNQLPADTNIQEVSTSNGEIGGNHQLDVLLDKKQEEVTSGSKLLKRNQHPVSIPLSNTIKEKKMEKTQEKNIDEGAFIKSMTAIQDKRQIRIGIPEHIVELLGIKAGDKFNWYIKNKKGKVSLRAVYIRYAPSQKYFENKELL